MAGAHPFGRACDGAADKFEETLPVFWVGDAAGGELRGRANAEECRFELGVRAYGLTYIDLLIAHLTSELRAIGKEFALLHNPTMSVRAEFTVSDATLCVAPADGEGHGLVGDAACTNEIADLGLRIAIAQGAQGPCPRVSVRRGS